MVREQAALGRDERAQGMQDGVGLGVCFPACVRAEGRVGTRKRKRVSGGWRLQVARGWEGKNIGETLGFRPAVGFGPKMAWLGSLSLSLKSFFFLGFVFFLLFQKQFQE